MPNKNIKLLGGYPLIAFSIAAAKLCSEIHRVVVSTDSAEIGEIATFYGAEVPFLRPAELAEDSSPAVEYVRHALDWLHRNEGSRPELVIQLLPTTPLREPTQIDAAIQAVGSNDEATSLRSVHELAEPPQKMMGIEGGLLAGLFPDDPRQEYYNLPRQAFPTAYHPNGYVEIMREGFLRSENGLFGPRIVAFVTPFTVEVDRPEDFELLEYLVEKNGHPLHEYLRANFPNRTLKNSDGRPMAGTDMSGSRFPRSSNSLREGRTRFSRVNTPIPAPESLPILKDLARYESRSMHGQLPVVWDRAEDFQVWDKSGNYWIDFTSTIFVANSGHANPHVKEAIEQMLSKSLLHSYTFPTEIRSKYLKRLIQFTPGQFEKAFLLSSGTEATECALKLMRLHGRAVGKRKGGIISFEGSMHGRTLGAQMLGGTPAQREWIGYEDPNIYRLPFPYRWSLESGNENGVTGREKFRKDMDRLQSQGADLEKDLCGFMLEPYVGWCAAFYPQDYVQAASEFAGQNKILVTFDEIQGGFGRTGRLFAYQHYGVEPDLICCGKGISSSVPLSAVLGRAQIMDLPEVGSMSSTHSANPLSCAAGLATIESIERLNLVEECERKGRILFSKLGEIQSRFRERIAYVMGNGLLAALILVHPGSRQPDAETATKVCESAMQKGLLLVHTGRESIKIGPPLSIPDAALLEGLDILSESIAEVVA